MSPQNNNILLYLKLFCSVLFFCYCFCIRAPQRLEELCWDPMPWPLHLMGQVSPKSSTLYVLLVSSGNGQPMTFLVKITVADLKISYCYWKKRGLWRFIEECLLEFGMCVWSLLGLFEVFTAVYLAWAIFLSGETYIDTHTQLNVQCCI